MNSAICDDQENDEIEERARKAYFRLHGSHADQPAWVEIRGRNVILGNVHGPLARFKIMIGKQGFRLHHIDDNQEAGVSR